MWDTAIWAILLFSRSQRGGCVENIHMLRMLLKSDTSRAVWKSRSILCLMRLFLRLSENIQMLKSVTFHGWRAHNRSEMEVRHVVYLAPADSESLECPHALIPSLNITLVGQVKLLRMIHSLRRGGGVLYESSSQVGERAVKRDSLCQTMSMVCHRCKFYVMQHRHTFVVQHRVCQCVFFFLFKSLLTTITF